MERTVAQWIFRGDAPWCVSRTGRSWSAQIDQSRGAFVRKIDLDEAIEIHDVYSALEELAARSAARHLSGTQIAELRSLVESMEEAAAAEELDRYYSLNVGFHKRFMEGSGNRRLLRVYNRLLNELPRFGLMQRGEMHRSNREYHQILDRIAAGEPEQAAEAMRCHTSERRRKMLLSSDKFGPKSRG